MARRSPDRRTTPAGAPAGRHARLAAVFALAAAAGFLAALAAIAWWPREREPAGGRASAPAPAAPSSVPRFREVAAEAGIRFRHEAGSTGRFYYPEVMGAGCAFFDADGDGRLDIFFVNGNLLPPDEPSPEIRNRLYRNRGDGTFEDITDAAGVGDASYGQGCCAADYDGDGDQDLYVTNFGPNILYRNRGDGSFEKLDGMAADPGWGQSCAFFDADADGDLDLYVQNYLEYSLENHEEWYITIAGERVLDYCSPTGYRGQQDRLYINDGGGVLRDATEGSGIERPEGTGMGLVCTDLDDDGDLDIVVSNDSRANFCFENIGGGKFAERALSAGLAYNDSGAPEAFMGIDAGDYDGDGRLDLAIPALRTQGFNLYRNLGGVFADVSVMTGVDAATSAITGFSPVFLDCDSDGDLDLFFTAGEVRMGRTDAAAGSTFEERYSLADRLLENRSGRFVDVSASAGAYFESRRISRACAAGDYDDDGDIDLVVTVMGGPAALLCNETAGGRWIGVKLVGRPPNLDAVGARCRLVSGGKSIVREISAGGSYLGQRDRRLHFGLGASAEIDRVEVRWPDGSESVHRGLAPGRYHAIEAPPR